MCAESYSWEIRENAEELFIIDGLTYEQVAEKSGVSIAQLKRWGTESEPTWTERRREYRAAQTSIRRGVMLAKAKLVESVLTTQDPMKAFAFQAMVKSGQTIEEEARERNLAPAAEPQQQELLEVPEDINVALAKAIRRKIATTLGTPGGITLNSIKEVQQSLALLEKLQAREAKESGTADKKDRQLDAETIKQLREQFGL